MKLDNAIVDYVNSLKIVRTNLAQLSLKDLEHIYSLLSTKLTADTSQEASLWFADILKENPELKLMHFFIALNKFLYQPGEYFLADQSLERFFHALEKSSNTKLVERICSWLTPQINSTILLEQFSKHLKAELDTHPHDEEKYLALIDVYRKLLHQKIDDVKLTETVANLFAGKNDVRALFYYRTLLELNQKQKIPNEIVRVWNKLLTSQVALTFTKQNSNAEWLTHILNLLVPKLDAEIRIQLFKDFFQFLAINSPDETLGGFKLALENQVFLPEVFEGILKHWNELYHDNDCYQLFIKLSGLKKTINLKLEQELYPLKLLQQIEEFEKLIALGVAKIILHRSFGLGIIKNITVPEKLADETNVRLTIDFKGKKKHEMSLRIAATSLEPCYEQHLLGLKYFFPEKFSIIITLPPDQLLLHSLKSLGKEVSTKELKNFLVPEIFDDETWKQKWKEIKSLLPRMTNIRSENGNLAVIKSNFEIELPHLESGVADKPLILTEQNLEEIITHLEKAISKSASENEESLEIKLIDLISDLEKTTIINQKKYFFSILALAHSLKITETSPWSEQIQEATNYFANTPNKITFNILKEAYSTLQLNSSRNSLLIVLETIIAKELYLEFCVYLLNTTSTQLDYLLEHLLSRKGEKIIGEIFEQVNKEYLTSADIFTALLKIFFDKKHKITHEPMNLLFHKMIKLLQQYQLNINFSSGKNITKKNYAILNRLLFEDGHLFNYLKKTQEINLSEKTAILKNLEEMTFLDNHVKRQVRELHTTLTQI